MSKIEVEEHEYPSAQPVDADLEARTVGGERIRPGRPVISHIIIRQGVKCETRCFEDIYLDFMN